jgi:transcriptional regulator with XRE-family HTH domain
MATAREQLADMLRYSRIEAGYGSHGALARKLNVSRPVVTKAENPAHPVPSDAILAAWSGATGAPLDPLIELAQRAKSGTPDWFMPYRQAESEAQTLRCWAPQVIPGLLQVESYARAVLSVESYAPAQLTELVAARLDRQSVIGRAYVTAIIDHHVLNRLIGSPAIMAEQCTHLATTAERPDVAVHMIPEGTNMGLWGTFDLATRDGTTIVCLTTLEDITSAAPSMVDKALRAYEQQRNDGKHRSELAKGVLQLKWRSQLRRDSRPRQRRARPRHSGPYRPCAPVLPGHVAPVHRPGEGRRVASSPTVSPRTRSPSWSP